VSGRETAQLDAALYAPARNAPAVGAEMAVAAVLRHG
jgi:hypothetical protein